MPYRVIVADGPDSLKEQLGSALSYGPLAPRLPVGGRTLIFATPAATVTFSGSVGSYLTLETIVAEIIAVAPTTNPRLKNIAGGEVVRDRPVGAAAGKKRMLIFQLDTGLVIDKDGTANPYLKIPTDADTTSGAAVAAAKIVGFSQGTTPGQYLVLIAP